MKRKRMNRQKPTVGLPRTEDHIPLFPPHFHPALWLTLCAWLSQRFRNSPSRHPTAIMATQITSTGLSASTLVAYRPPAEPPNNELRVAPAIRTFHWLPVTCQQNPVPTTDLEALHDWLLPPSLAHFTTSTPLTLLWPSQLPCRSSSSPTRSHLGGCCLQGRLAHGALQVFAPSLLTRQPPARPLPKTATPDTPLPSPSLITTGIFYATGSSAVPLPH